MRKVKIGDKVALIRPGDAGKLKAVIDDTLVLGENLITLREGALKVVADIKDAQFFKKYLKKFSKGK